MPSMGRCLEFGPQISADCNCTMVAGGQSCSCPTCGVVCTGRFSGCERVWQLGTQPVGLREKASTRTSGTRRVKVVQQPRRAGPVDADRRVRRDSSSRPTAAAGEPAKVLSDTDQQILRDLVNFPDDIAKAIASALKIQHQLIVVEVQTALLGLRAQLNQNVRGQPVTNEVTAGR